MGEKLHRFLGDNPFRVAVKLIMISLFVGIIMSVLGISPQDLWADIRSLVYRIYHMGFETLWQLLKYLVWGAMIVVPVFLFVRLLKWRR